MIQQQRTKLLNDMVQAPAVLWEDEANLRPFTILGPSTTFSSHVFWLPLKRPEILTGEPVVVETEESGNQEFWIKLQWTAALFTGPPLASDETTVEAQDCTKTLNLGALAVVCLLCDSQRKINVRPSQLLAPSWIQGGQVGAMSYRVGFY